MGVFDKNKSKTTGSSTALSEPWKEAQPALKTALGGAESLYNKGQMFKPFARSTVIPYAGETMRGMRDVLSSSAAAKPMLRQNMTDIAGMAQGSGFNPTQQSAIDQLGRVSRGDYLDPNNNPGFASVLKQAQDASSDAVNMSASGAGRYGSGVHQGNLAREVGNVTGNLLYGNYNTERGRQDQATGDMFNAGQQGIANRQRAQEMLPGAFQSMMAPDQAWMNIGSMQEDLATRKMNDTLRRWQGDKDSQMRSIEWLSGIGGGAGALGGSKQAETQAPRPNPFMSGLGGAIGGGAAFGPLGGLIGGGLGLLGGLF